MFHNWVKVHNYDIEGDLFNLFDKMMDSSLLQCAAFHGLTEIVEWLLTGVVQGSDVMEALCAASERGHIASAKLLSAKYIDIGIHDKKAGIALIAASRGGHKEIFEQLLNTRADVNTQEGMNGNALQAAVTTWYGLLHYANLIPRTGPVIFFSTYLI
jgi:hypothetical protein